MENLINKRVKSIEISGIRKFYNLASKYEDVLSLTIGQPDFVTPLHIKQAAIAAIEENKTTYTANAGLEVLRQAVSTYVDAKYSLNYSAENEIIITNGASEAIDIALRTILEEGCEVILPAPVYPGYEPLIRLMGAIPVYIDTRSSNFQITAKQIEEKLSTKTRCVILPSPSNPTGCTLGCTAMKEIHDLLQDKDIFVLSDEIYSELLYDEKHISIGTFTDLKNKTIIINGLSKSHSMTGWRIGYTLAPDYITKNMLKVHQYNSTCASSISQYAALEALTNGFDDAEMMKKEYLLRRDYVYDRLVDMKLSVIKPGGAFYIFPSIQKFGLSSFDFASRLLEAERVAVVPGSAFSDLGDDYIRISYAYSMKTLEDGLDRIQRFIHSL